jgi:Ca-activated chloride channel family protein
MSKTSRAGSAPHEGRDAGRRVPKLLAVALTLFGCAAGGTLSGPGGPNHGTSAQAGSPAPGSVLVKSGSGGSEVLQIMTEPGELPVLELASDRSKRLPLEHTHVKANLTGYVAEVEVTQTYTNPHEKAIEAVYVFPLPENSAVNALRMVIGKRVIEGEIQERGRARRTYETARDSGHTAALLEQERPNVFTQSVANIAPGEKIDVVVRYVQDLSYDDGRYEFVFPMVVGPRYMPGRALAGPNSGDGTHEDTNQVPDASRISPPYVGKGERSGHDISLEVTASTALAVADFEVPTHEVLARKPADGSLHLALSKKDSLPNRDFVLRYRVAGKEPKATLFLGNQTNNQGFFSLVVQPPVLDVDRTVGRREVVFVVDVSGSMSGTPLAMCKSAMREALGMLRPVDTFNVITFAGATAKAFPVPRAANDANLKHAFEVVDRMEAGGGTEMLDAVAVALSPTVESGRHRYVFFLTDGYVGNEAQIIDSAGNFVAAVERGGQRARVFSFGVGSSINRHLIDGLARAGKGTAVVATTREDPARAVNRFYHYIDHAILEDLAIDFGTLKATELYPIEAPDLFASRPVILHGTFSGTVPQNLAVKAKLAGKEIRLPVSVRPLGATAAAPDAVLGLLFARSKVTAIEETLWDRDSRAAEREIVELGERFKLVTRFTSLVAVDRSRTVSDGSPETVVQPLEEPEGVDVERAGRRQRLYSGRPRRVVAQSGQVEISESIARQDKGGSGSAKAEKKPTTRSAAPPATAGAPAKPAPAAPPTPDAAPGGSLSEVAEAPAEAEPTQPAEPVAAAGADEPATAAPRNEEAAAGEGYPYSFDDDPLAAQRALNIDEESNESAPPSTNESAKVEPKRGCGCGIPTGPVSPAYALAALGLLAALVFRRRGRS